MKTSHLIVVAGLAIAAPAISHAQVAGTTLSRQLHRVARCRPGLERQAADPRRPVYNDSDERIGSIDDVIVTTDKSVSYAMINAGGFLAVARHDVAVPVSSLKLVGDKLVLAGATKDALKASPPFEYPN